MNAFWKLARKFCSDRLGNIAIIGAVTLPVLIGFVGLGVEAGYWYFENRRLQASTDLAAYAGAVTARAKGDAAAIAASAQTEAVEHSFEPSSGKIEVNWPPKSGANINTRSVEVIVQQQYGRYFSSVFTDQPLVMLTRAVATYEEPNSACVIALDETAGSALEISGYAKPNFRACSLMANSIADDAVAIQGSAEVTTSCVTSAGGVYNSASLTMNKCREPRIYMPRADDPYASIAPPDTTGSCDSVKKKMKDGKDITVSPGKYCGGLSLTGNVTLDPGVYVISGGTLQINSNTSVTGSDVTFYLTNGARVIINGTADIDLTAPTDGPYRGLLFFADRTSTDSYGIFNGTADSRLVGSLYFPSQHISMRGDFGGSGGCTRLVAGTIDINGNPTFDVDCESAGIDKFGIPGAVLLVE